MAYTPVESDVHTLVSLLECGLSGRNSQEAYRQLCMYEANSSFCSLLTFVLSQKNPPVYAQTLPFPWMSYREIAGLTLKNNISKAATALGEAAVAEAARCSANILMQDSGTPGAEKVCQVASQIVARVTAIAGLQFWSASIGADLPAFLLNELLASTNQGRAQIGLLCLQYLFEDCANKIGESSEMIIRRIVEISENFDDRLRRSAMNMVLQAFDIAAEMDWNVDNLSPMQYGLCNCCFTAAVWATRGADILGQRDAATMKIALLLFQHMLEYLDYLVAPQNDATVVEQMLQWWISCSSHNIVSQKDADLASCACDLLAHISTIYERCGGEGPICVAVTHLRQHVATLVPALFPCMLLKQEEEVAILELDHISNRDVRMTHSIRKSTYDEDADVCELLASLRESSTRCLDKLARVSDDVFASLSQMVSAKLHDQDWRYQEVAILALGAVAEGCFTQLAPFLPTLIEQLFSVVRGHPHVLVTSIALWTLQRMVSWMTSSAPTMLAGCVTLGLMCLDVSRVSSKRVHWAALTFLKELVSEWPEDGRSAMASHLPSIMTVIHSCLIPFHTNNLALLCDFSIALMPFLDSEATVGAFIAPFETIMPQKFNELIGTLRERYVAGNDRQLVHKDVFDLSRVVAEGYRLASANSASKAAQMLKSWVELLNDMLNLDAPDDVELIHYPLDIAGRFAFVLDTATLQQLHGPLVIAVLKCLGKQVAEIRQTACEILSFLVAVLKSQAVPSLQQTVLALIPSLHASAIDGAPVEATNVLVQLVRAFGPMEELRKSASLVAQQVRTDTFGSLTMPCLATSTGIMLQLLPQLATDEQLSNIARVLAQCPNSEEKASATTGVMHAFTVALSGPQAAAAVLPGLLKLVYSWQQCAHQFDGVMAAITSALTFAKMHVGDVLAAELSRLSEQFRSDVVRQYGLL